MEHAKKLLKQELDDLHFIQESNYKVFEKDPNRILVNKLSIKDFTDQTAKKIKDIELALQKIN